MRTIRNRVAEIAREWWNFVRFGPDAPRPLERLWIDPQEVSLASAWFRAKSGRVRHTWPPAEVMPFEEHPHIRFAVAHWRDGVPWEDTGAYDYMMDRIQARGRQDDCRTLADVVRRFDRLDQLFETVKAEGRLKTREEICRRPFREAGGILIHLGPNGELVIGDAGKHRLMIAKLARLSKIPVLIGEVHIAALPKLAALRVPPVNSSLPGARQL